MKFALRASEILAALVWSDGFAVVKFALRASWCGKAPKVALKLRIESWEWRIGVEKLLWSLFFNTWMWRFMAVAIKGELIFLGCWCLRLCDKRIADFCRSYWFLRRCDYSEVDWHSVGQAACLPPYEPHKRLLFSYRREAANVSTL